MPTSSARASERRAPGVSQGDDLLARKAANQHHRMISPGQPTLSTNTTSSRNAFGHRSTTTLRGPSPTSFDVRGPSPRAGSSEGTADMWHSLGPRGASTACASSSSVVPPWMRNPGPPAAALASAGPSSGFQQQPHITTLSAARSTSQATLGTSDEAMAGAWRDPNKGESAFHSPWTAHGTMARTSMPPTGKGAGSYGYHHPHHAESTSEALPKYARMAGNLSPRAGMYARHHDAAAGAPSVGRAEYSYHEFDHRPVDRPHLDVTRPVSHSAVPHSYHLEGPRASAHASLSTSYVSRDASMSEQIRLKDRLLEECLAEKRELHEMLAQERATHATEMRRVRGDVYAAFLHALRHGGTVAVERLASELGLDDPAGQALQGEPGRAGPHDPSASHDQRTDASYTTTHHTPGRTTVGMHVPFFKASTPLPIPSQNARSREEAEIRVRNALALLKRPAASSSAPRNE
jgi:hypothetical protein